MSCVVYLKNKKSGHVYAYESVSYRDPVTRQPKSKRTFIGRVDPVTKQLLDPEKAERLKQKRGKKLNEPSETMAEPKTISTVDEQSVYKELDQIKETLRQEHDQLLKVQEEQRHTRETVLNAIKMIQESLLS